jgi:quercetin dioxygenase-like cupin family protein
MSSTVSDTLRIGELELRFLADDRSSVDSLVMFEFAAPPRARVPTPHYHRDVDEAVYGLAGVLTVTLDGRTHELKAGECIVIPRGQTHQHENRGDVLARALVVMSPGTISRRYFEEMAAVVNAGGPPDPNVVQGIMRRYGLIPA